MKNENHKTTSTDSVADAQPTAADASATEKFDQWAIVELMGHRKLAGRVTEHVIAGASLLRIDVPDVPASFAHPELPGFTQFYGASSIYCLTPTTKEIVLRFTAYRRESPVQTYELPPMQLKGGPPAIDAEEEG